MQQTLFGPGRTCRHCHAPLDPRRNPVRHPLYCGDQCKTAAWHIAHKDIVNARSAAWHAANKDIVNAQTAARYAANPDIRNARNAAWRAANPDKTRAIGARRRARKAGGVPQRWRKRDDIPETLCYWCGADLSGGGHLDHIMPISLGGPATPSNEAMTCAPCNLRKSNKHPLVWIWQLLDD